MGLIICLKILHLSKKIQFSYKFRKCDTLITYKVEIPQCTIDSKVSSLLDVHLINQDLPSLEK